MPYMQKNARNMLRVYLNVYTTIVEIVSTLNATVNFNIMPPVVQIGFNALLSQFCTCLAYLLLTV